MGEASTPRAPPGKQIEQMALLPPITLFTLQAKCKPLRKNVYTLLRVKVRLGSKRLLLIHFVYKVTNKDFIFDPGGQDNYPTAIILAKKNDQVVAIPPRR